MKLSVYFSPAYFSNCYILSNPDAKDTLIIDPGLFNEKMLLEIEDAGYTLSGILITHNHLNHTRGVKTLQKIYDVPVIAVETEIGRCENYAIAGDGFITVGSYTVQYFAIPGHSLDSLVYVVDKMIFTGDAMSTGLLGSTNSVYSANLLQSNLQSKIMTLPDSWAILPGYGPPSTVATERKYNKNLYLAR